MRFKLFVVLLFALNPLISVSRADVREYHLTIAESEFIINGKARDAMTINGTVPGPVLRFTLGDEAVIHVQNTLRESTSLHWHGLLVPNDQDGVPLLTTPPIESGTTFTYRFPIKQTGTYWYHSHSGLQEQSGIYGAIVIDEPAEAGVTPMRDEVLLLSDWTDENPKEVMRALMTGNEWYAIRKKNYPSIVGAIEAGAFGEYLSSQWLRMAPMDISDVAYDAFLINGQSRIAIAGVAGERVRLRIINGSSATYFFVQSATGNLEIVSADGMPVTPLSQSRVLIGIAETYDAIVTIPADGSWEFRATSQDGSGHASAFIGAGDEHLAPEVPKASLYGMDGMLQSGMESHGAMTMDHETPRPAPPYRYLQSPHSTAFADVAPRREVTLRLTGDMERYLWSINNLTVTQESTIPVQKGEVLRMTLVNDTMMHHPMHLHGHFFRVVSEQGDQSPLKHTIDVPPMGRRVIEFEANESGDWFFHCHILYHMDMGMSRVVTYAPSGHVPALEPNLENTPVLMVDAMFLSNMTQGEAVVMVGREDFGVAWSTGYDIGSSNNSGMNSDMHSDMNNDYQVDAFWSHYISPNLSTTAGLRMTNQLEEFASGFAGIEYRLPLMVDLSLEIGSEGNGTIGLGKNFAITDRVTLLTSFFYDTYSLWDWQVGLDYRLDKAWSLTAMYSNEHGFGAGMTFRY